MRIAIRWKQQPSKRDNTALLRFRAVLSSAAETRFYRPWLHAARLLAPGQIERLATISEALACVPRVELSWFLQHEVEFRSRRAPPRYQARLMHRCDPSPRTAILALGFEQTGNTRCFERSDREGLLRFGPECLSGPVEALAHVAQAVRCGDLVLPALRHSVVVFSDVRGGLMLGTDHDTLWHAFQVPIFEQLRGLCGELLATECEAHNGLHLCGRDAIIEFDSSRRSPELLFTSLAELSQPAIRLATGWTPTLDETACPCGSRYPRILSLTALEKPHTLARAAAS